MHFHQNHKSYLFRASADQPIYKRLLEKQAYNDQRDVLPRLVGCHRRTALGIPERSESCLLSLPFEVRQVIWQYVIMDYIFHVTSVSKVLHSGTRKERRVWYLTQAICAKSFKPGMCPPDVEQLRRLLLFQPPVGFITGPYCLKQKAMFSCSSWCHDFRHKLYPKSQSLLALPLTSRQVYDDWQAVFYSSCTFALSSDALTHWAMSISERSLRSIRRLQVCMWMAYDWHKEGRGRLGESTSIRDLDKTQWQMVATKLTGLSELVLILQVDPNNKGKAMQWLRLLRSQTPQQDRTGWKWLSVWKRQLAQIQSLLILGTHSHCRTHVSFKIDSDTSLTDIQTANLDAWRQVIEESTQGRGQEGLDRWMLAMGGLHSHPSDGAMTTCEHQKSPASAK